MGEARRCRAAGTSYQGTMGYAPQEREARRLARRIEKARLRAAYYPMPKPQPVGREGRPQGDEMGRKSPVISLLSKKEKPVQGPKLGRAERRIRAKRGARSA